MMRRFPCFTALLLLFFITNLRESRAQEVICENSQNLLCEDREFHPGNAPISIVANNREGKTRYFEKKSTREKYQDFLEDNGIEKANILSSIKNSAFYNSRPPVSCARDLYYYYQGLIGEDLMRAGGKNSLLLLRELNLLDDVVLKYMFAIQKAEFEMAKSIPRLRTKTLTGDQKERAISAIQIWQRGIAKDRPCLSSLYRNLHNQIRRLSPDFENEDIIKVVFGLYREGLLTDSQMNEIHAFHKAGLGDWRTTIAQYIDKRKYIQGQNNNLVGHADWISKKRKKIKQSIRERIYRDFDQAQLTLMANIVKKLAARLRVTRGEIVLYEDDSLIEIIPLDPMEIYRMTIRLLRKELVDINNSSFFTGSRVTYEDVIAASYEAGYIKAIEIQDIVDLKELWEPKKTIFQKLKFWIQTATQTASILTPPPWNFLGVLALIVIDTYTQAGEDTFGHQHSIF